LDAMPRDPSALAILGDAVLELGQVDEAAAIYERLGAIAGGPALDIRNARLAFVTGDRAGALDLARKALIAASGGGADGAETADPAVLGFYHFALGEYARLSGDATLAQEQFGAALALRSADLGALLGQARVHAFSGDLGSAIRSLEAAVAIAPTPEAEALLGDLFTQRAAAPDRSSIERAADRAAAATAYGTVALTRTLSALAGAVYDRQLILFDLEHGAGSTATLDAARAALEARPDAAGHDLVAWALHRLGRDVEAWSESQAARATGAADARILFHAGAIAAALGDHVGARALLAQALALGPGLDPQERTEAMAILEAP
ncbi:MAG: hypothetical protein HW391_1685, partial [Chloroflexi bacterium]|nr:hypothetical protein [Chloroflexota bacterium]